jgi:hypothetical protein
MYILIVITYCDVSNNRSLMYKRKKINVQKKNLDKFYILYCQNEKFPQNLIISFLFVRYSNMLNNISFPALKAFQYVDIPSSASVSQSCYV